MILLLNSVAAFLLGLSFSSSVRPWFQIVRLLAVALVIANTFHATEHPAPTPVNVRVVQRFGCGR